MAAYRFISAMEAVGATLMMSESVSESRTVEQKIEAAVREHAQLVFKICYAVVRNHHDAEDATQETFMRVVRYSSKLAGIENPKTWLARVAWRVWTGQSPSCNSPSSTSRSGLMSKAPIRRSPKAANIASKSCSLLM